MPRMLVALGWMAVALLACPRGVAAQDMSLTQITLDGHGWELVGEGYKFTEGPAIDADGNVYFSDVPNGRIYRVPASGRPEVYIDGVAPTSGLMFGPDGKLYGAQIRNKRVVRFEGRDEVTVLGEGMAANDLVVSGSGHVYTTDFAAGKVWHIPPGGTARVVAEGLVKPNGIILWPDQGTLVVADSATRFLWAYRVEADGSLSAGDKYYELQLPEGREESGADGMTVDTAGRLYVASHVGLQVFDPTGRLSGVLLKPQPAFLSNVVLGGAKLDTLYVTSADKVFRRRTKATGLRYLPPK